MTSLIAISLFEPPYLYVLIGLVVLIVAAVVGWMFRSRSSRNGDSENDQIHVAPAKPIFKKRPLASMESAAESEAIQPLEEQISAAHENIRKAISVPMQGVADLFEDEPAEPTADYFEEDDSIFSDSDSSSIELNLLSESDANFRGLRGDDRNNSLFVLDDELNQQADEIGNNDTDVGLELETTVLDPVIESDNSDVSPVSKPETGVDGLGVDEFDLSGDGLEFAPTQKGWVEETTRINVLDESSTSFDDETPTTEFEKGELLDETIEPFHFLDESETRESAVDAISVRRELNEQKVDQLQLESGILKQRLATLQSENDALQHSLASRKAGDENSQMRQQELENLRTSLSSATEQINAAKIEKSNLLEELARSREKTEQLEAQTSELSSLETKLHEMEAKFDHALTEKAELAQRLEKSLENRDAAGSANNASGPDETHPDGTSTQSPAEDASEISQLEMMLEQAEEHRTVLAIELKQLREQLANADEVASQAAKFQQQIESLKIELNEKDQRLQSVNQLQSELAGVKSRLSDGEESAAISATKLVKLESELAAKQKEIENAYQKSQQLTNLERQLEERDAEFEALNSQFESSKKTLADVELSLAEKQADITSLLSAKENAEATISSVRQQNIELTRFVDELATAKKQNEVSRQQLERNRTDFLNQSKYVEQLKADLRKATTQTQSASAELISLNEQLAKSRIYIETMTTDLVRKQSALETAEKAVARFSLSAAEKELVENELRQLKASVTDAEQIQSGLKHMIALASERESKLQGKVGHAEAMVADLQADRERLENDIIRLKKQLANLTAKSNIQQKRIGVSFESNSSAPPIKVDAKLPDKEHKLLSRKVHLLQKRVETSSAKLAKLSDEKKLSSELLKTTRAESKELRKQVATYQRQIKKLDAALAKSGAALKNSAAPGKTKSRAANSKPKTKNSTIGKNSKSRSRKQTSDNLEAIDGIGPKIKELLIRNRIDTFEKLAKTKVVELRKILANGGAKFSRHDPKTWARQSRLAAASNWDALEKLQDELKN